jgi:uncharacterized repeat protein (TIGR04076 family)
MQIPEGGYICMWALQSLMPLITAKERETAAEADEDWMWRVHHVQCPDPKGRVIFKIERVGKAKRDFGTSAESRVPAGEVVETGPEHSAGGIKDLRVEVESVDGHCTSRMKQGDHCMLRGGRLYIPAGHCICLYALQAAMPLLPAKQRALQEGDWLKEDCRVLCPDPAGNVILRIEPVA